MRMKSSPGSKQLTIGAVNLLYLNKRYDQSHVLLLAMTLRNRWLLEIMTNTYKSTRRVSFVPSISLIKTNYADHS